MQRLETRLDGPVLLAPTVHGDERGFFVETFRADVAKEHGIPTAFVQDNHSRSRQGTLRGVHFQTHPGQGKLVRVARGQVFDVVVDLRPDSPTYRNRETFDLTGDNQVTVYVPAGCAHGFQALTEPADVSYRIDRAHDPSEDVAIRFDDPELDIPWPLPITLMSERDKAAASLALATARLT